MTPGGRQYSQQHAVGDLHVLHGDYLAEFCQGVNISDLIQELHTVEKINSINPASHLLFEHNLCQEK